MVKQLGVTGQAPRCAMGPAALVRAGPHPHTWRVGSAQLPRLLLRREQRLRLHEAVMMRPPSCNAPLRRRRAAQQRIRQAGGRD